jgi:hypothetical protein
MGRVKMATSTSSSHQSPSQAGPRLAAKFEARQGDIAQAALHRPSDERQAALVALPGSAFQVRAMGTVAGDG